MPPEFEELIRTHNGRILAIASRYAERDSVEDLYQEILEQLWRSFDSFRGESKPETWIYRIGFNTAMTSLRKKVRQRRGVETENAQAQEINEGQEHGQRQERAASDILSEFIDSLADIDASILIMYLDGLTGQEMTEALGMNLNTIQVRISRLKTTFTNRYVEVS